VSADEAVSLDLPGLMSMRWTNEPTSWTIDEQGLQITAPAGAELFTDPSTGVRDSSAPRLLADVSHLEHYRLSAKVSVGFASTYDAGVLALWATPDRFAKFCFEYSPQGQPMAVSVVTRGVSDDANGFTVDGTTLWMRIAKTGPTYAFHASTDGSAWQFVRHFELAGDPDPQVGFLAQSPTGPGCTVRFSDIRFDEAALTDLRDGT
jgi:regulation of enolase protein 1 (concanavalin A-like superfamily)